MQLSLFDLHCDTASELYLQKKSLLSNDLHVGLDKLSPFEHYAQVFAVYTDSSLSDEDGYTVFHQIADHFDRELVRCAEHIGLARNGDEISDLWKSGRHAAILAVEDARLLSGDLGRLRVLYDRGVRFLTLTWAGVTSIGGSWDTSKGLTDFGCDTVRECFRLGIVPDVSHASEQTADGIMEIAYEYRKPFIASHSNSHSLYAHPRNLCDRHFEGIKELGGIVGVSLCPGHLCKSTERRGTVEDIFAHIDHYLAMGGEDIVGFGADWDGTDLPDGISTVGDLTLVAEIMARHNYTDELIEKIYWKNFYNFSIKNL